MIPRTHVLIVVENLTVPFDTRVWQECLALREIGYEVSVICPKGEERFRKPVEILDGVLILRHDLPIEASGPFGYFVEYLSALFWQRRLAQRLYRHRPFQIIQACNPPDLTFLVARRFKRRYGVSFIFDHHDLSPEIYLAKFGRRDLLHRILLHLERRTFAEADYSIATNESYRHLAVTRGGMAPERVVVVRSGPRLERMYRVKANDCWKHGRGYLVAYVGVMGRQDGLEYLLEAARIIRFVHGRLDLQFVLVGNGPDLPRLQALAISFGIEDIVEFTGRLPDEQLREILSTADVCVSPDEYNELNDKSTMNKIMEYMAVGKPIVQFDLREGRFSAQESSLYAKPNDCADLAEKILWILRHPEQGASMGRLGHERVVRELAWDHEKPKYVALYECAGGHTGGRLTDG